VADVARIAMQGYWQQVETVAASQQLGCMWWLTVVGLGNEG